MPEGPGFDPQAMRQAADMMASMGPEALEQMSSMAASRHVGLQQQQQPSLQQTSPQAGPAGQQAVEAMQVCSSVPSLLNSARLLLWDASEASVPMCLGSAPGAEACHQLAGLETH